MVVNTSEKLMTLGFSEYEARTYLALLKEYPATAYETAKNSAIPSAKIYGVLSKLKERGLVLELEEEGRKRYAPQDPDEFLDLYRRRVNGTLDTLSDDLKMEKNREDVSYIWNINSYGIFLEKAEALIRNTENYLLLSVGQEELAPLKKALREKEKEGCRIAVVYFGAGRETVEAAGQVFGHPIADTLYEERGGRGFAAVGDGKTAMVGTITRDYIVEGAWSTSSGFVTVAEDYIKHDIYIMKIVNRFDAELKRRFGQGYAALRDVFTDREV